MGGEKFDLHFEVLKLRPHTLLVQTC